MQDSEVLARAKITIVKWRTSNFLERDSVMSSIFNTNLVNQVVEGVTET